MILLKKVRLWCEELRLEGIVLMFAVWSCHGAAVVMERSCGRTRRNKTSEVVSSAITDRRQ